MKAHEFSEKGQGMLTSEISLSRETSASKSTIMLRRKPPRLVSWFSEEHGAMHREETMKFLHSMIRVYDLEKALDFFVGGLGLKEVRRRDSEKGRYTLVFLETGQAGDAAQLELTYNWDEPASYSGGRNFGHLAFEVAHIYDMCRHLQSRGVCILRPPRDGRMAFVRSPDDISIELLQKGEALALEEPWASMPSQGSW